MSADKRSIATDALEVLGTVIKDKKVGRDAVHLACLPVIIGDNIMAPGEHVGLDDNGWASRYASVKIGIIDPFLAHAVPRGNEVLLIIYPRVISSLRHVWTHPFLPDEGIVTTGVAPEPLKPFTTIGEAAKGVKDELAKSFWTRERLIGHLDVIGRALEHPVTGERLYTAMDGEEWITIYGIDAHEDIDIPLDLWAAFETINARRAENDPRTEGNRGIHFSCSC